VIKFYNLINKNKYIKETLCIFNINIAYCNNTKKCLIEGFVRLYFRIILTRNSRVHSKIVNHVKFCLCI